MEEEKKKEERKKKKLTIGGREEKKKLTIGGRGEGKKFIWFCLREQTDRNRTRSPVTAEHGEIGRCSSLLSPT